ncbi:MmgE/PrpD family protein [Rhizobium pusense]|nr:hypothetical protein [Agrobacterium pusense]MDH0117972.1 MmgE/PrpD family protein [Agrobacterium pusense]
MAGADGADLSRLKIGPDMRYEIRDVGFKAFSCCRIIQSSVEAAVEAFALGAIEETGHDVRQIEVFAPEIVCRPPFNDPEPRDIWAAQFSAPFAIAMGVLGHAAGPEWFAPSRFADRTVRKLTAKIRLFPLRSAIERITTTPQGFVFTCSAVGSWRPPSRLQRAMLPIRLRLHSWRRSFCACRRGT